MAQTVFDSLWNFNQPAETEEKFRALISQVQPDPDQHLQLLTQIARTQGLQRKFDEAHITLDDVQKKLNAQTPVAAIRYLLERGRIFNSSKNKAAALPLFMQAYEAALTSHEDNLAVDAAHMVALAESTPAKQMEWNLKAVQLAEQSQDPQARKWLGSLYNNIGWTYHEAQNYLAALEIFKKALAFREMQAEPNSIRIAKWCIARTYRSLNRIQEALTLQKSLDQELETVPNKDGYVYEELGELYLTLKQYNLSKDYFKRAYSILSLDEGLKTQEAPRLIRIKQLSE